MDIGARYDAAVIWKNGEPTYLTDGTGDAQARAVSMVNNDVYVLGYDRHFSNNNYIKIWKNSTLIYTITNSSDIFPTSMYVDGSDVYITGGGIVWKNGVQTANYNNSVAGVSLYTESIFVKNKNVYVAGYRNSGGLLDGALLWTNDVADIVTNAAFYSVFVYNNDVYAVGDNGQPIIWKNGVITSLSNNNGSAMGVFIVPSTNTAINKIANVNTLIYPNPTNNSFVIDYNGFIQVKIYDMLGKEILTQNANGKTEINISNLSNGIYIVKILSENKVIGNSKIVKQ